jgi:hypothetical protein
VIILRLFPGLLTNGIAEIPKIRLDKAVFEFLPQEKRDEYVTFITDRQQGLASAFREHMTKGQTYHTTNPYRKAFFTDVINEAKEVNFLSFPVFVRMTVFSSFWENAKNLSMPGPLRWDAKARKRQAKCSVAS